MIPKIGAKNNGFLTTLKNSCRKTCDIFSFLFEVDSSKTIVRGIIKILVIIFPITIDRSAFEPKISVKIGIPIKAMSGKEQTNAP